MTKKVSLADFIQVHNADAPVAAALRSAIVPPPRTVTVSASYCVDWYTTVSIQAWVASTFCDIEASLARMTGCSISFLPNVLRLLAYSVCRSGAKDQPSRPQR